MKNRTLDSSNEILQIFLLKVEKLFATQKLQSRSCDRDNYSYNEALGQIQGNGAQEVFFFSFLKSLYHKSRSKGFSLGSCTFYLTHYCHSSKISFNESLKCVQGLKLRVMRFSWKRLMDGDGMFSQNFVKLEVESKTPETSRCCLNLSNEVWME